MTESFLNQRLVFERLERTYRDLIAANDQIAGRGTVIVGGGTALTTFVGGDVFLAEQQSQLTWYCLIGLAIATLAVFLFATLIWSPSRSAIPGTLDVSKLWEGIIDQDVGTAYANLINDLIGANEQEIAINDRRACVFRWLVIAVWVQVSFAIVVAWL